MSPKAQMIAPVFVAGILSCRTARVMPPLPPQSNVGTTSEADEQERITSTLLQRPELANRVRNQRVVPIRFSMGPAAKDDNAKVIATVVFFNYDEGQAFRVQADRDGAVLAVEELKGRPAASVCTTEGSSWTPTPPGARTRTEPDHRGSRPLPDRARDLINARSWHRRMGDAAVAEASAPEATGRRRVDPSFRDSGVPWLRPGTRACRPSCRVRGTDFSVLVRGLRNARSRSHGVWQTRVVQQCDQPARGSGRCGHLFRSNKSAHDCAKY